MNRGPQSTGDDASGRAAVQSSAPTERGERPSLTRLLRPESVAVVGATDTSTLSETVASIFDNDGDAYVVNPKYPTVFGRPTHPSLTAIGRPIDAVFSLLSARGT